MDFVVARTRSELERLPPRLSVSEGVHDEIFVLKKRAVQTLAFLWRFHDPYRDVCLAGEELKGLARDLQRLAEAESLSGEAKDNLAVLAKLCAEAQQRGSMLCSVGD